MTAKAYPHATDRKPSIGQALVDDVRLVVMCRQPTEEEFDEHVKEALAMNGGVRAVLVVGEDDQSSLSAKGRAKLRDAGLLDKRTAVMTKLSVAVRGIMTALHWLGADLRGFMPHEFEKACDFLAVSRDRRPELVRQIGLLREHVGAPTRLDPVSETTRAARDVQNAVANRLAKIRTTPKGSRSE